MIQLATGAASFWAWSSTGREVWLRDFFHYQGAIYFIFLDAFEFRLCISAWKQFKQREPLGSAWLAISIAMFFRLAGDLFKHWLCIDTRMNPLHYAWRGWNPSAADLMEMWGNALAGPLFMGTLAVGMLKGLQHYKRVKMLGKLKPADLILIGGVGIYALYVISSVIHIAASHPSRIRMGWILTWPNDLMLALLLFEAILLMRTAFELGPGYVGRIWGAFAVAIFLTSVESLAHWMTMLGYFNYPENSVMWYIWFIWAAAFAMGPAYQVDAINHAKSRGGNVPSSRYHADLMRASRCP